MTGDILILLKHPFLRNIVSTPAVFAMCPENQVLLEMHVHCESYTYSCSSSSLLPRKHNLVSSHGWKPSHLNYITLRLHFFAFILNLLVPFQISIHFLDYDWI